MEDFGILWIWGFCGDSHRFFCGYGMGMGIKIQSPRQPCIAGTAKLMFSGSISRKYSIIVQRSDVIRELLFLLSYSTGRTVQGHFWSRKLLFHRQMAICQWIVPLVTLVSCTAARHCLHAAHLRSAVQ